MVGGLCVVSSLFCACVLCVSVCVSSVLCVPFYVANCLTVCFCVRCGLLAFNRASVGCLCSLFSLRVCDELYHEALLCQRTKVCSQCHHIDLDGACTFGYTGLFASVVHCIYFSLSIRFF